jgi:hypothetical protein
MLREKRGANLPDFRILHKFAVVRQRLKLAGRAAPCSYAVESTPQLLIMELTLGFPAFPKPDSHLMKLLA